MVTSYFYCQILVSLSSSALLLLLLLGPMTIMAQKDNGAAKKLLGNQTYFKFAVVPKFTDSPFFQSVREGCMHQAAQLSEGKKESKIQENITVECLFVGPKASSDDNTVDGQLQARIVRNLLWGQDDTDGFSLQEGNTSSSSSSSSSSSTIDGLAISVQNSALMTPILQRAREELGIPVVTFDSDVIGTAGKSKARSYYIGTNNTFFGEQLARIVEQLQPNGGTYAILSGTAPNLDERRQGLIRELHHQSNEEDKWIQLDISPLDPKENVSLAIELLHTFAQQNPAVIVSTNGLPMREIDVVGFNGQIDSYTPWIDFVDENRHRNITYICGDDLPHQMEMLSFNYVNGLVGQLPYQMGMDSISALFALLGDDDDQLPPLSNSADAPDYIGTNVLTHVHVPLQLPPIEVDENRVDDLKYMGYVLFAVTAATAIAFATWVTLRRNVRVIRVAQPRFLIMICAGVLILSSCIIPASMDDKGRYCNASASDDYMLTDHCTAICMSVPWLTSIGFTITFSALYSKTRRVNKIFHSSTAFGRVKVSERDVLIPFFILLGFNVLILLCWTLLDPLIYNREPEYGRDGWNRVIATRGSCQSDNAEYFLIPLALVNIGILLLANWQAIEARDIEAEFAETKYIALCMASLLQACISGIPVLFVVRDNPQAFYMVFVLLVFIISMVLLLLIFVPKIIFTRQFLQLSTKEQQEYMAYVIQKSSEQTNALFSNQRKGAATFTGKIPAATGRRPYWMQQQEARTSNQNNNVTAAAGAENDDAENGQLRGSLEGAMMFIRKVNPQTFFQSSIMPRPEPEPENKGEEEKANKGGSTAITSCGGDPLLSTIVSAASEEEKAHEDEVGEGEGEGGQVSERSTKATPWKLLDEGSEH
jgi:gamma-aminobutyric acid type B receptor